MEYLAISRCRTYWEKDASINNEIFGEDFHKMLLAIQNLIEYLNRNYFKNDKIEDKMNTMTKTLYDPWWWSDKYKYRFRWSKEIKIREKQ